MRGGTRLLAKRKWRKKSYSSNEGNKRRNGEDPLTKYVGGRMRCILGGEQGRKGKEREEEVEGKEEEAEMVRVVR